MLPSPDFPNLHAGNHHDTSPASDRYNCLAWAAGRDDQWWEPAGTDYWPANVPRDYKLTSLVLAYESVGYAICADGAQESGVEKIALYADGEEYRHAALQLETGKWTSKMGAFEDIEHDAPEDVAGPCNGQVAVFMKRERSQ
jgi:hypothetical protein